MTAYRSIFVALRPALSNTLEHHLRTLSKDLLTSGHRASICDPNNFHVTVAFCKHLALHEASRMFQERASQVRSMRAFDLSFEAVEGFDSSKLSPRVLFATPTPTPTLHAINTLFRPLADQDQHPHLTLARSRSREASMWMQQHAMRRAPLGSAHIASVYLMANNGSSIYVNLDRIDLQRADETNF